MNRATEPRRRPRSPGHAAFMRKAIDAALAGIRAGRGGPFGAVVVRDGLVVGVGTNRVTSTNDPTAHAEVVAIRAACRRLGSFQLDRCAIYTTCEPCPMCLGAIYWARPAAVFYACAGSDAAKAGFDDRYILRQLRIPARRRAIPMKQIMRRAALQLLEEWRATAGRKNY